MAKKDEYSGQLCVFVVVSKRLFKETNTVETEVNAVYRTVQDARDFGKFLINQPEYEGSKYISYEVETFIVL